MVELKEKGKPYRYKPIKSRRGKADE